MPRGRPPGIPKTGGRQKGTVNKRTLFLYNELSRVNFDWAREFTNAFASADPVRLRILVDILPYLVAKIKEREEPQPAADGAIDVTPQIKNLSTEEMVALLKAAAPQKEDSDDT